MTMLVPASYNDLKREKGSVTTWLVFLYQRTLRAVLHDGQASGSRFAAVTHIAKVYLNGELDRIREASPV